MSIEDIFGEVDEIGSEENLRIFNNVFEINQLKSSAFQVRERTDTSFAVDFQSDLPENWSRIALRWAQKRQRIRLRNNVRTCVDVGKFR